MPSLRLLGIFVVATLVGGAAGGWLDYNTLSDNDAVRALAVRLLAAIVAFSAWVVASRGRGRTSGVVAISAALFLGATFVGGWIAPSIHPAGWSAGSAHLELRGALIGTDDVKIECNSGVDGTRIGITAMSPAGSSAITRDTLGFDFAVQSESPLSGGPIPASAQVSLNVNQGTPDAGRMFANDPEAADVVLSAQGTSRQGQVTFANLPNEVGKSGEATPGGTAGAATLAGSISWVCDPGRNEPTAVDGSWFR